MECDGNKDKCEFRFDLLEVRMDKLDEREAKRIERDTSIEKAIIEIQTSNKLIAQTLEKLQERVDSILVKATESNQETQDKWMKILEKLIYAGLGVIGALLGEKLI